MFSFALQEELEKIRAEMNRLKDENDHIKKEIKELEKVEEENNLVQLEVEHLQTKVKKANELLHQFLNDDQISALSTPTGK